MKKSKAWMWHEQMLKQQYADSASYSSGCVISGSTNAQISTAFPFKPKRNRKILLLEKK